MYVCIYIYMNIKSREYNPYCKSLKYEIRKENEYLNRMLINPKSKVDHTLEQMY